MEINIKGKTETILSENSTFGEIKASIDNLYNNFSEISQLNGKLQKAELGSILPSGEALSPQTAAGSILDYIKTTKFLRGIKKGIDFQLDTLKKEKINIMYVGTGPFASLIFPLLPIYTDKQLEITAIDYHEETIGAMNKIINEYCYGNYFDEILAIDATTYQNSKHKQFDIIIIDTVQKALFKEPQVALTNHFSKFLTKDGILIPEEIKISAVLADLPSEFSFSKSKWTEFWLNIKRNNAIKNRIFLKEIFILVKNVSQYYNLVNLANGQIALSDIKVTRKTGRMKNLILLTEIKIFEDIILSEEDETGLTKLYFDKDVPSIEEGMEIRFSYQFGSYPRFVMDVKSINERNS